VYPKGQAHLTALGSFLALERVMGLFAKVESQLYLGANLLDYNQVLMRLKEQEAIILE